MGTQNLWWQTRVNSNTSSASWAWYNVTGLLQKSSSDKRLKTNVRFSNVNALDAIDRMRVRSFNRIDEGGLYYSIGFIADELEEINQNLFPDDPVGDGIVFDFRILFADQDCFLLCFHEF